MLTLHFIRHGQTNFNAEKRVQGQFDSVLTDLGIAQAREARLKIAGLKLKAVYASSNIRARHTAEILTENLRLDIAYKDGLREIMLGSWQERLYSDAKQSDPDQMQAFAKFPEKFALKGAETFGQVQERGVKCVEDIIKAERQGHVLIVSHGVMIKTILCHYAKVDLNHLWEEPHLGNCSHSIIKWDDKGGFALAQVGDKSPLGTIWAQAN